MKLLYVTGNKAKTLEKTIKKDERYNIEYAHSARSGHIVTASKTTKGDIMIYDPQTNKKVIGHNEVNKYFFKKEKRHDQKQNSTTNLSDHLRNTRLCWLCCKPWNL